MGARRLFFCLINAAVGDGKKRGKKGKQKIGSIARQCRWGCWRWRCRGASVDGGGRGKGKDLSMTVQDLSGMVRVRMTCQ